MRTFFCYKKVNHVSKNAYLLLLIKTYFCNHLLDNNVFLKKKESKKPYLKTNSTHFLILFSVKLKQKKRWLYVITIASLMQRDAFRSESFRNTSTKAVRYRKKVGGKSGRSFFSLKIDAHGREQPFSCCDRNINWILLEVLSVPITQ